MGDLERGGGEGRWWRGEEVGAGELKKGRIGEKAREGEFGKEGEGERG